MKKFHLFFLFLFVVLALAGCSNKNKNKEPNFKVNCNQEYSVEGIKYLGKGKSAELKLVTGENAPEVIVWLVNGKAVSNTATYKYTYNGSEDTIEVYTSKADLITRYYEYDEKGNETKSYNSGNEQFLTTSYEYDGNGRITKKVETAYSNATTVAYYLTETYQYEVVDEMLVTTRTSVRTDDQGKELGGGTEVTYSYTKGVLDGKICRIESTPMGYEFATTIATYEYDSNTGRVVSYESVTKRSSETDIFATTKSTYSVEEKNGSRIETTYIEQTVSGNKTPARCIVDVITKISGGEEVYRYTGNRGEKASEIQTKEFLIGHAMRFYDANGNMISSLSLNNEDQTYNSGSAYFYDANGNEIMAVSFTKSNDGYFISSCTKNLYK